MANSVKIAKLKTHQYRLLHAHMPMALKILITKFKFHQYILRAKSPNLVLAKLSRYTEYYVFLFIYRQFNESRAMHTSSPSPYSPSPTRRSLSPSPAMLAPSGSSGVGFTPPSPLRGRTQSFGSAPQGTAPHGHHHAHAIHSSSTTSLPTRSGILPSHSHTTTASLQQVSKGRKA